MNEDDLKLILVYPPFRGYPTDEFFIQAFNDIYPYVEAVSVMTYDFSSPQKPGNFNDFVILIHTLEHFALTCSLKYIFNNSNYVFK